MAIMSCASGEGCGGDHDLISYRPGYDLVDLVVHLVAVVCSNRSPRVTGSK